MSYQDKIDTKLNKLQKELFRLFRKSFPHLIDRIEIEKGIIHPENFCFSVSSESQVFGKLSFDIDDIEITVFSDFDHRHFATYNYDEEKNKQRQILLTCQEALEYVKDFVSGNIIVEYKEQAGKVLQTFQYHKNEPSSAFSATINLTDEKQESNENSTIVTKKINWYGELD